MARSTSTVATSLALLVLGLTSTNIDAFGVSRCGGVGVCRHSFPGSIIIRAAAEGNNEEVAAEKSEEEEEVVVAEAEPEEDPEVTALKAEIAELETTLKQKNRDLNSVESMVDKYSKAGYARKVAELDQLRKMRRAASQSNSYTGRAAVLQSFLPVLDKLNELNVEYSDDEIAKSYAALKGVMTGAFKDLKAEEFSFQPGDVVDTRKMNVVEEIYSDDIAKGCIIEQTETNGWILEGNVMRLANVVASLGSEADAAAEEEEEAATVDVDATEEVSPEATEES